MDDLRNLPPAFNELFKKTLGYLNGECDLKVGETIDNVVMGVSHPDATEDEAARILEAVREYSPYVLRKGKGLTVVSMVSLMKIFHDELFSYSMDCAKRVMNAADVSIGLHYKPMMVIKNETNPRMAGFTREDLNLGFVLPAAARELGHKLVLTQSFATNYPASLFARYLKTITVEGDGEYRIYEHGLV